MVDVEGLGGVALRSEAADDQMVEHAVGAEMGAAVGLEHLTAQVQALAAHARAVRQCPAQGVAMHSGG